MMKTLFDAAWNLVKEDFSISIDPNRDRSKDDDVYNENTPCPLCGTNSMAEHACGTPGNYICNDCWVVVECVTRIGKIQRLIQDLPPKR